MKQTQTVQQSFFQRVYEIVATIPSGSVMSYGQIARLAGSPQMARQVGWALRACDSALPWHRVVNREGRVMPSDPAAGISRQRQLLEQEGVEFNDKGLVKQEYFCIPTGR